MDWSDYQDTETVGVPSSDASQGNSTRVWVSGPLGKPCLVMAAVNKAGFSLVSRVTSKCGT